MNVNGVEVGTQMLIVVVSTGAVVLLLGVYMVVDYLASVDRALHVIGAELRQVNKHLEGGAGTTIVTHD